MILDSRLDKEIVDWASENTPVFGSRHNAEGMSDKLKGLSFKMNYGSSLLVPDRTAIELRHRQRRNPAPVEVRLWAHERVTGGSFPDGNSLSLCDFRP